MASFQEEYKSKLRTADQIAAMVKSGEAVQYGYFTSKPEVLDKALAKRHAELQNILVAGCVTSPPFPDILNYKDVFTYQDWHWSKATRALSNYYENIVYAPLLYHMTDEFVRNETVVEGKGIDHSWQQVGPMDEHGNFNFGPSNTESLRCFEKARCAVVEVNQNSPRCLGGENESVHISQIDFIVEAPPEQKLFVVPDEAFAGEPPEFAMKMAENIVEYMRDGDCIQLGIGDLPTALGKVFPKTDLKDIGIHSEMFVDAYVDMIDSGQANGRLKQFDKYKAAYTFAIGTQKMFDWMHENTRLASYSVDITNDPRRIGALDNMVSINQALQMDLFTQVNAEKMGYQQISGNGGMTDFTLGAQWSKGGRSFICLPSTHTDKEGNLVSRIVPTFDPGSIVTISRHFVDYVATEYGVKRLKAQHTWYRTEAIIELAHPQFRDELIKQAGELKIWTRTNKQM
ncbi:MAG: acetyl-CoA hydrolase/transferase family protein [Ignavibacteriales bacterium]